MRREKRVNGGPRKEDQLAIHKHRSQFLDLIADQSIVIISGLTGCGKSTQAPQYLLEAYPNRKIAVCQPRRLAAISLAQRVSSERKRRLGCEVGYHIGMESSQSRQTRLIYMTYGILTQQLLHHSDPEFDFIILDEVHERSLQMDMLCVILKKIINQQIKENTPQDKRLKLIIMSATLNNDQFQIYFAKDKITSLLLEPQSLQLDRRSLGLLDQSFQLSDKFQKAPIVLINDQSKHKVRQVYFQSFCKQKLPKNYVTYPYHDNATIYPPQFHEGCSLIQQLTLDMQQYGYMESGDILVFLPGMMEIQKMKKTLLDRTKNQNARRRMEERIVEVHSAFSQDLSAKLFHSNIENKILLSTNIGQSSITLPHCKVVIDYCLSRKVSIDKKQGISKFHTIVASKSNLIQRKGRVGRVSDGIVFRMITAKQFEFLSPFQTPEIKCVDLQLSILKTKKLSLKSQNPIFENLYNIFLNVLDPPQVGQINLSIKNLVEQNALSYLKKPISNPYQRQKYDSKDLNLTKIGEFMVNMPCDIKVSKLILMGMKLGICPLTVNIAAILTSPKSFFIPEKYIVNRQKFIDHLVNYNENFDNDYLLRQNIFYDWKQKFYYPFVEKIEYKIKSTEAQEQISETKIKSENDRRQYKSIQNFIKRRKTDEQKKFCENRGITAGGMRQILRTEEILRESLSKFGFEYNSQTKTKNQNLMLKFCLMYAFPHSECQITFRQNRKSTKIQFNPMSYNGFNYRLVFNFTSNITVKQIQNYINPHKNENNYEIGKRNPNWLQIYGTSDIMKKFILPGKFYVKQDLQKNDRKQYKAHNNARQGIFQQCLKKQAIGINHQFKALYKNKGVTIFSQSINKHIVCEDDVPEAYQEYLISHSITINKNQNSYLINANAIVARRQLLLGYLMMRRQVEVKLHESNQFIEEIRIDGKIYRLSFFVKDKQIKAINKARNTDMDNYDHKADISTMNTSFQSDILSQGEIEELSQVISQENLIPVPQNLETIFVQQNMKRKQHPNRFIQWEEFYPKDNLIKNAKTYHQKYKIWKQTVYKQVQSSKFCSQIQPIFVCIHCYKNDILQKVANVNSYNANSKKLALKDSPEHWKCPQMERYPKPDMRIFCNSMHEIGITVSTKQAMFLEKSILLYQPYKKTTLIENIKNQKQFIKQLDQNHNVYRKSLNQKHREYDNYQCKICADSHRQFKFMRKDSVGVNIAQSLKNIMMGSMVSGKGNSKNNSIAKDQTRNSIKYVQDPLWDQIISHFFSKSHTIKQNQFLKTQRNTV